MRSVEHCPVESPSFPGLPRATPSASRAGIVNVELLRTRDDPSPVPLSLPSPLVELDLADGGTAAAGLVPVGTYRFLRYSLAYASVTTSATLHYGSMTIPGQLEYDVATAPHTSKGRLRPAGELEARFTGPGVGTQSFITSIPLDCPLSETGGVVDTGVGTHRITVPTPGGPLTLDALSAKRELLARFPLAGAVTWRDLKTTGFAPDVLDIQAGPTGSEAPARNPICELLLSDRCASGAKLPRLAADWPMPDSPTQVCTDGNVVTSCPDAGSPGFGQDGSHSINSPTYVATSQTVRDETTGLRWQRVAPSELLDWWAARDYCEALVLEGRDDWSLPSRVELVSLMDVGRFSPSIDLAAFPAAPPDFYWSASAASFSSLAFGVRFDEGFVYDHDPRQSGRVRCVTDGKPSPAAHLLIEGETARDPGTGLVWQRAPFPVAAWLDALAGCENLDLAGKADWRLPSIKELLTIVEDTAINPSIDVAAFPDTPAQWLWSSSPGLVSTDYAWGVSLTDGYATPGKATEKYYFHCVRTGPRGP